MFQLNAEAIRQIQELQRSQGFEPCFGRKEECDQLCCCFRQICKPGIKPDIKFKVVDHNGYTL